MKQSKNIIKRRNLPVKTRKKSTSVSNSRSTKLLDRAGYISDFGSGLYGLTALGQETRKRIEDLVRNKHLKSGFHEVSIPSLQYSQDWKESGRWEKFEGEMFTLENRDDTEMCLAPTHEEGVVRMFRNTVRSYKDLPITIFQIKEKHRDDKAREGLLRGKEFVMKDAYSMHASEQSMQSKYEEVKNIYRDIFSIIGLEVAEVDADVGVMGGSNSMEFVAPSQIGDDNLLHCNDCRFGVTDEHESYSEFDTNDNCPECDGELHLDNGVEVGHIFALGQRYSSSMDFNFDTETGGDENVYMASYGIGITRLIQTTVDQNNSDNSCKWTVNQGFTLSPFDICVIQDEEVDNINEMLADISDKRTLLYEGNKSIGEQFSESDLIGVPVKLIFANHWRSNNEVEIELYNDKTIYCDPEDLESEINSIWS